MRASVFVPVFALAAFAQDESSSAPSSSIDAFPQTSFLQQTNSLGVVTGQPAVFTSQPSQPAGEFSQPPVVTSVGVPASIPALGTGIHTIILPGTNSTAVVSVNNSTAIILQPTSSGASGSGSNTTPTDGSESGSSGSPTNASGTGPASTGGAAAVRAVAGGLVGAGAFMAAFL